jgi:hypothetical protein
MDMMTIILVFLLKSYSTEDVTVQASEELQIPASSALTPIKTAVNLVITKNDIILDGELILSLEPIQNDKGATVPSIAQVEKKGQLITDLYERLLEKAEEAKEIGSRIAADEAQFKGQILLQCDRTLPFSLIREVMYTAGQAQFGEFRFVVVKASG